MFVYTSAFAAWKFDILQDEMDDSRRNIAEVSNGSATFLIYEESATLNICAPGEKPFHTGGCTFSSVGYKGGLLVGENEPPIHYEPKRIRLRVDKNKPFTLIMRSWEPGRAFISINELNEDAPRLIRQLTTGNQLLVEYPKSRNTTSVLKFTLKGSRSAICKALHSLNKPSDTSYDYSGICD